MKQLILIIAMCISVPVSAQEHVQQFDPFTGDPVTCPGPKVVKGSEVFDGLFDRDKTLREAIKELIESKKSIAEFLTEMKEARNERKNIIEKIEGLLDRDRDRDAQWGERFKEFREALKESRKQIELFGERERAWQNMFETFESKRTAREERWQKWFDAREKRWEVMQSRQEQITERLQSRLEYWEKTGGPLTKITRLIWAVVVLAIVIIGFLIYLKFS